MSILDIIAKKRDGLELSKEEIEFFIQGICDKTIADYQASALLMAIRINGMSARETADLTISMMNSGDVADLSSIGAKTADKHSTGGVGDTVTLIAVPLAAACGCKIAKMSGRALGHTGGTIDKMDSIGINSELSVEELIKNTKTIGCAVAQQTGELAPADKILYQLRDVTATVDSIPLIASSILSKKFATGADVIVLDVKTGSGALMKTLEESKALAKAMVDIGYHTDKRVCAFITGMEQPLGRYIGNRLEVYDAIMALSGKSQGALLDVSVEIAAKMMELSMDIGHKEALSMLKTALESGAGLEKLREMIKAQGGDISVVGDPEKLVIDSKSEVLSEVDGYISSMDTQLIGEAARALGAGRMKKTDPIDFDAGIIMNVKIGDKVNKGDRLALLVCADSEKIKIAEEMMKKAIVVSLDKPIIPPVIYDFIQ
ncbi:MAG: thymidine phosphorylase [Clostridia bacterium]|nr:thymidine phosphorylase [Clostridia bacterium]